MSSKQPIDVPLEIRTIAQMCDPTVETWKMRRRLLRWHKDADCTLLVKVNGRWQVTIASLRRVWPSFGQKFAEQEDIDDVRGEVDKITHRIRSCEVGLQNVRARENSRYRDLDERIRNLEKGATERDRSERQSA